MRILVGAAWFATVLGSASLADDTHPIDPSGPAHQISDHITAGKPGTHSEVTVEIEIHIVETPTGALAFFPQALHVERGTTARITFENETGRMHEVFLGSHHEVAEQRDWRAHRPETPINALGFIAVAPHSSAELVWTFSDLEAADFVCLQPGHFSAGLRGLVIVDDHS